MDYMDVYTTYTLLSVAALSASVVALALFNAYIATRVRRDSLFWLHCGVQGRILALLMAKTFELVAPTESLINAHITAQKVMGPVLALVLAAFLAVLRGRLPAGTRVAPFLVSGLLTACIANLRYLFLPTRLMPTWLMPKWLIDSSPVLASFCWNIHLFSQRRSVFADMSELSIDGFMENVEDAILIFDRSNRLVDYNRSAFRVFPFIDQGVPTDAFHESLAKLSGTDLGMFAGQANGEPLQLEFSAGESTRYYMYHSTQVGRGEEPVATVLTFHDVTEQTLLLRDLDARNAQLEDINKDLARYISMADRLEDEREKSRAVAEVQEVVGRRIADLLAGLEETKAARLTAEPKHDIEVDARLVKMIEDCRAVMKDVRQIMAKLADPGRKGVAV